MPNQSDNSFTYCCNTCGETHSGFPDYAADAPDSYSEESRDEMHAVLTSDTCTIGDDGFFVRGCLDIPVHGRTEPFSYGVWVSLSRVHYEQFLRIYDNAAREEVGPWFGWLCNAIPGYENTLLLKTNVHIRRYPLRPLVELEPTDHQLAVEQREGITIDRLREICEALHHRAPDV